MDRRRLLIIAGIVLLLLGLVAFSSFRYLVVQDIERGGLEFQGRLVKKESEWIVHLKLRSTFLEKGNVRIVDARLGGQETIDAVPIEVGETGPWKEIDLRFAASDGPPPTDLEITARFNTLFSEGAAHRTITVEADADP